MLQAIYFVLNTLLLVAVGASAVKWFVLLRDHWGERPANVLESIVPARIRQRPFWTPFDALIMLSALIIVGQLTMVWMIGQGWIEVAPAGDAPGSMTETALLASTAASSITGLSAAMIVIVWLRLFDRDARRKLGLTFTPADLWLGLQASLMILPPVMLISAATAYYVPYEHPVLDSLAEISTPGVFAAIFFGTGIVAPLVEELLLRVLLQGGLQGWADHRSEDITNWKPNAYWPIVVTSFVFAVLHLGQGAAPIPLFFLSLGLGFLYRQTGCIAAPMIVHMVLNGVTLIAEFVKLQSA